MLPPILQQYVRRKAGPLPVSAQITSHTFMLTGVKEKHFFSDPDLFLMCQLAVSAYYDLDVPSLYYDMYNIEAEALGQKLLWPEGMFPEIDGSRLLLRDKSSLDRLSAPDPRKSGRMAFIREVYKRAVDMGIQPGIRFCAPFTLAANTRGLENLVMDVMTDPPFTRRLFEFLTFEVLAPWIGELRSVCGPGISATGADALASLPITNPEIIENYALGYVEALRNDIGHVGVSAWWGERYLKTPEELMSLKLRGSPASLRGYDPDVYAAGPERFAVFAASRGAGVRLGIDSSLLTRGAPGEVVERAKQYARAVQGNVSPGIFLNEVTRETPSAHVHAAVNAVRRSGLSEEEVISLSQSREAFGSWCESNGVSF
jgi:hypothetical protein